MQADASEWTRLAIPGESPRAVSPQCFSTPENGSFSSSTFFAGRLGHGGEAFGSQQTFVSDGFGSTNASFSARPSEATFASVAGGGSAPPSGPAVDEDDWSALQKDIRRQVDTTARATGGGGAGAAPVVARASTPVVPANGSFAGGGGSASGGSAVPAAANGSFGLGGQMAATLVGGSNGQSPVPIPNDVKYFEYPPFPAETATRSSLPEDPTLVKVFVGNMRFEMGRQTIAWTVKKAANVDVPIANVVMHWKSQAAGQQTPTGCACVYLRSEDAPSLLDCNQRIFCGARGAYVAMTTAAMRSLLAARRVLDFGSEGRVRGPKHAMVIEASRPAGNGAPRRDPHDQQHSIVRQISGSNGGSFAGLSAAGNGSLTAHSVGGNLSFGMPALGGYAGAAPHGQCVSPPPPFAVGGQARMSPVPRQFSSSPPIGAPPPPAYGTAIGPVLPGGALTPVGPASAAAAVGSGSNTNTNGHNGHSGHSGGSAERGGLTPPGALPWQSPPKAPSPNNAAVAAAAAAAAVAAAALDEASPPYHLFPGDEAYAAMVVRTRSAAPALASPVEIFVGGICYEATAAFVSWMLSLTGVPVALEHVALFEDSKSGNHTGCAMVKVEACKVDHVSSFHRRFLCDSKGVYLADEPGVIPRFLKRRAARGALLRGPTHAVVIERRRKPQGPPPPPAYQDPAVAAPVASSLVSLTPSRAISVAPSTASGLPVTSPVSFGGSFDVAAVSAASFASQASSPGAAGNNAPSVLLRSGPSPGPPPTVGSGGGGGGAAPPPPYFGNWSFPVAPLATQPRALPSPSYLSNSSASSSDSARDEFIEPAFVPVPTKSSPV